MINHWACPKCYSPLLSLRRYLECVEGHRYDVKDGIPDFVGQSGDSDEAWSDQIHDALEGQGMEFRVERYIVPWLDSFLADLPTKRVLDNGCGSGDQVRALREQGFEAIGIDPGIRSRKWQGQDLGLARASGLQVPLADSSVGAVVVGGVLEHIGEPSSFRARFPLQRAFIRECLRVLAPGGRLLLAHPNGAFPIDFWHASAREGREVTVGKRRRDVTRIYRVHLPYEAWMPNQRRIRSMSKQAGYHVDVRAVSPMGYLSFARSGQTKLGQVLQPIAEGLIRLSGTSSTLAGGMLNPWLVSEVRKME